MELTLKYKRVISKESSKRKLEVHKNETPT